MMHAISICLAAATAILAIAATCTNLAAQSQPAAAAFAQTVQRGPGKMIVLDYPAGDKSDPTKLRIAVTYTLWIPDGVKTIRGVIVHQHGAGMTASKEGSTAAYDLQWQALAQKWDCALLGPCYHVLNDGDWGDAGSIYWADPRRGSDQAMQTALKDFAVKTGHPEIAAAPWVLWGHSAGGIWSDVMTTLHPERVVAGYFRSGTYVVFRDRPLQFPPPTITPAGYTVPIMCSAGIREKWITETSQKTYREFRAEKAPIGYAADPKTDHDCGDSRYFAIPYLDACMAMRLPDPGAKDQRLKPVDSSHAWLAPLMGDTAVPAAEFKGKLEDSVWLPNEAVAKAWMQYVKTGAVDDATPPPAPYNARLTPTEKGVELTWNADGDFESGIGGFVILRDGEELAKVPEKPIDSFGWHLFQGKTYHDTPAQPLRQMRYADSTAKPGEKHVYTVININSVGLKSAPSEPATATEGAPK